MVHIKEKADSILIILSAQGRANYFLAGALGLAGAFSGTFVPSTFLCFLTSFFCVAGFLAGSAYTVETVPIASASAINNDFMLFSL